MIHEIHIDVSR